MEVLYQLFQGFSIGFQPLNLLFCFTGCLIGTLVGVLPGIGPTGAISILLPVTFRMDPVSAIIMLAGIYYGSMYGGSITSVLVNIPGEAASVVTCLDGYEMAKKGRAGAALGIAAFGSFIAGTIGIVGLMFLAQPLSKFALNFGPPEYFAVILLGLTLMTYLSQRSTVNAVMMAMIGIILSCIGLDPIQGTPRMSFNILQLLDGIDIVPLAMGLFGVAEVFSNLEETAEAQVLKTKIASYFPNKLEWVRAKWAIARGTFLGFLLGIIPGSGAVISSFVSYGVEKRMSPRMEEFGKGAIEGVAGPESANNAATSGAFVPLLTLGIPSNIVMALLFGALIIHGVRPGPLLLQEHPQLFWGLISSMYIGNVMLLVLNLPLIPVWVQVLKVPYRILFPLILVFCILGSYALRNSSFDVLVMIIFGIVGYLFKKFECEPAPLILAFVLGPMLELNLRQSLISSRGDLQVFFTRPISAVILSIAALLIIMPLAKPALSLFRKRKKTLCS